MYKGKQLNYGGAEMFGSVKIGLLVAAIFLGVFAYPWIGVVQAVTITITPVEVGFVDNDQPTINMAPGLEAIGVTHYLSREQQSFLMFDLSTIGPSRAILSMSLVMSWSGASQFFTPLPIDVYHVSNDAWTTDSITWNTKPEYNTLLASIDMDIDNPAETFTREWEFNRYNFQSDIRDGLLSLAIAVPINTLGNGIQFKLDTFRGPYLKIEVAPVPESSTVVLFSVGLVGIVLLEWRRRRRSLNSPISSRKQFQVEAAIP